MIIIVFVSITWIVFWAIYECWNRVARSSNRITNRIEIEPINNALPIPPRMTSQEFRHSDASYSLQMILSDYFPVVLHPKTTDVESPPKFFPSVPPPTYDEAIAADLKQIN